MNGSGGGADPPRLPLLEAQGRGMGACLGKRPDGPKARHTVGTAGLSGGHSTVPGSLRAGAAPVCRARLLPLRRRSAEIEWLVAQADETDADRPRTTRGTAGTDRPHTPARSLAPCPGSSYLPRSSRTFSTESRGTAPAHRGLQAESDECAGAEPARARDYECGVRGLKRERGSFPVFFRSCERFRTA